MGFLFFQKIEQKGASPCYCIHLGSPFYNTALIGSFIRLEGSGRFHIFTRSHGYSDLLCGLGYIFFTELNSLFIHESLCVSFELINAGEGVLIWLKMRLRLSCLVDAFGLENLLVVIDVDVDLLLHSLFLLSAKMLLVVCERGGEK